MRLFRFAEGLLLILFCIPLRILATLLRNNRRVPSDDVPDDPGVDLDIYQESPDVILATPDVPDSAAARGVQWAKEEPDATN